MADLPTTIGPYRVLGQIGQGGMGAVFHAIHEAIERQVAIKILHPEYARKPEFVARFFNEARAVNRVNHSGLVQVSDYGQLPDGTAYIVMEYLQGETLGQRIKRRGGSLPAAETVRLAALIADSLAAAHGKNIIHRDLKPDNVIIVADLDVPGGERTKLLDFGIAKLNEDGEQSKTNTGSMLGTPLYMSPEQARGAGKADDRSDVYSLGVMLYVMLAGQPPFDGEGAGEIIGKHLYETAPPLQQVAPTVPKLLSELVARLLVKDKQQRPTMSQVATELRTIAEQLPNPGQADSSGVQSRPVDPGRQSTLDHPTTLGQSIGQSWTGRPPSRKRTLVLAGAAGVLVLGVTSVRIVGHRDDKPPAVVAPVSSQELPRVVNWKFDSEPSGVQVQREIDGKPLCTTPCVYQQPAASGRLKLKLHRDGFVDRVVQIEQGADSARHETMDSLPAPPPASKSPSLKPARANKPKSAHSKRKIED